MALVEVENDSCLYNLTRRSLLRHAGYEYIITESPDVRGIDVALLYQPFTFRPLCFDFIPVPPLEGMRPTRDILYVQGETQRGDTLHVFVVHAPSRYGGERATRPNRRLVADRLLAAISLHVPQADAKVIVCGDFNDGRASTMCSSARCCATASGRSSSTMPPSLWKKTNGTAVSSLSVPSMATATSAVSATTSPSSSASESGCAFMINLFKKTYLIIAAFALTDFLAIFVNYNVAKLLYKSFGRNT